MAGDDEGGEDDSYSYDVYRMQHTVMPQHSKPWKGMEGNNKHKIARNNLFEPPDSVAARSRRS